MSQISELPPCPAGNICSNLVLGLEDCGENPSHVAPPLAAEEICIFALRDRLHRAEKGTYDTRSKYSSIKAIQVASAQIEVALSPFTSDGEADVLFDTAEDELVGTIERNGNTMADAVQAEMLGVYMSAFRKRRAGGDPLAKRTKDTIRLGIADIAEHVDRAPVHGRVDGAHLRTESHTPCLDDDLERYRLTRKLSLLLLSLRIDDGSNMLYPASYRERFVGGRPDRHLIHDNYALIEGDPSQKVPIRITGESNGRAGPLVVAAPYESIIEEVADDIRGYGITPPADYERAHTGWLIEEANGLKLGLKQGMFLDKMWRIVERRVMRYEAN